MKKRSLLAAAASLVVAASVAGCGGADSSSGGKDVTINFATWPVIAPVPVMQQQGQLKKEGYNVKWVPVNTSLPGAASAMVGGKLDMAYANSVTAMTIFAKSPKVAIFTGRAFINMNSTVVRDGSGIKSVEDLAGQKVVMSGKKTASTLYYEIRLRRAGVKPDRSQYFVSGAGPSMVGVLASGAANVAAAYVPYSTKMEEKNIGHTMFTASEALGSTAPGDGLVVRREFAEKHPQAVVDVLKAMFSATDAIKKDPASHYQAMAKYAKVEPSTVKAALKGDIYAPSYTPDVDSMVKVAKLAQQAGFAPKGTNLAKFAKDTLIQTKYAKKALGSQ
ncbi:MAG: ABC transporter substrate-binding protein [Nocardioidaceae bacterium]